MVLHETTNPCHQRRKTKLEGHKLLAQSAVGEALRRGRAPPAGSSRVTRCRRLSVPKGRGSTLGGGGAGAAPIVGLSGGARAVHVRVGTRIGLVSWRVVAMRGVLRAGFGRAGLGAAGSTSAHRQGPRARQARRPICMTVTAAQANGWRRAGPRPPVAAGGKKRAPRAARALRVGALCKLRGKSQQAWCPRSEYCQAVMGPCAKCASELSLRVCTAAAAWGPGEGQGPRIAGCAHALRRLCRTIAEGKWREKGPSCPVAPPLQLQLQSAGQRVSAPHKVPQRAMKRVVGSSKHCSRADNRSRPNPRSTAVFKAICRGA